MKQTEEKRTIGCRVSQAQLEKIDRILEETGQSRSDWLLCMIRRELGEADAETVHAMSDRIAQLERKFKLLLA